MRYQLNRRRTGMLSVRSAAALVAAGLAVGSAYGIPAFPGAEGFGANALGGRGGDVYHVTSLADTLTPGTLRYGLRESGFPTAGRTIVFDVGGVINLTDEIDVKNINKVTIAGQTAPGGITLAGRTLQITGSSNKTTSNVIIRHIAVRGPASEDAISIKGSGQTRDIILDHVSTSWSKDELLSSTQSINNITVQNSFITEALNPSGHSYGSLVRPGKDSAFAEMNVSYHHNLYTNNKSRNPRPGTYEGRTLNFEFHNNVIYNYSDRAGYAGGSSEGDTEYVKMNHVGNYTIAGPSTPASAVNVAFTRDASNSPIDLKVYQEGNLIDGNKNGVRDGVDTGWGQYRNWNGSTLSAFPEGEMVASPHAFPTTTFDSAEVAYQKILANGGAMPWARAAVDQRYVNEVKNGTGAVINALPAEWNQILAMPMQSRPAGFDTDNDGMPNAWEIARALNPSVADNNGASSTGYTNLENYLHELTIVANWAVDADAAWGGILNWAGEMPNQPGATANFGPNISAVRTVSVDAPFTAGQINFNAAYGYTLQGAGAITIDVSSGYGTVDVAQWFHTIDVPVQLNDDTRFTIAPASGLTLSDDLSASGRTVTKAGAGVLQVQNVRAGTLRVDDGTVVVTPGPSRNHPSGTSVVGSLTIAAAAGTRLDLMNNALVIDHAGSPNPISAVRDMVRDGKITSTLAGGSLTVGYGDNAALNYADFGGAIVDGTSTLVGLTIAGDADLNGSADIDDFSALASGFNAPGFWHQGDFDHSGVVDIDDFSILASNFNLSAAAGLAARGTAVPEPGAALTSLFALMFVRRKK